MVNINSFDRPGKKYQKDRNQSCESWLCVMSPESGAKNLISSPRSLELFNVVPGKFDYGVLRTGKSSLCGTKELRRKVIFANISVSRGNEKG